MKFHPKQNHFSLKPKRISASLIIHPSHDFESRWFNENMKIQPHLSRRDFIRVVAAAVPAAALPDLASAIDAASQSANPPAGAADNVLLEAERFEQLGGWVVDQQIMDQMGSSYLLAHGLGEPVRDALTTAVFPSPGKYRVWVRTRDWVAPWKAPGTPGKFQVLLNGQPLRATFGTEGAAWHWQDGGTVKVGREATIALHDLTGFEGRCDAVLFCRDLHFQPPNELAALTQFRRAVLDLPEQPEAGGQFDLVVVGGGIAGSCAALSAARQGLTVALVQDRPVLGGNGSSEVRVWPEGNIQQPPYPRIGDVVAELVPERTPAQRGKSANAKSADIYADDRKLAVVSAEPRITLLTEQRVNEVETRDGAILSVVAQHTRTGRRVRLQARWFADCTGDATVGFLAGADYEMTRQGHLGTSNLWNVSDLATAKDSLHCLCTDTNALNSAVFLTRAPAPFPRCPWAIDLRDQALSRPEKIQQSSRQGRLEPARRLVLGERLQPRSHFGRGMDARPEFPGNVWRLGRAQERGPALPQPQTGLGGVHRRQTRIPPPAGRRDSGRGRFSEQSSLGRRLFSLFLVH